MNLDTEATTWFAEMLADASQMAKDDLAAKINQLGEEMQTLNRLASGLPFDKDLVVELSRLVPDRKSRQELSELLSGNADSIPDETEYPVLHWAGMLSDYVRWATDSTEGTNLSSWLYTSKGTDEDLLEFLEWCELAHQHGAISCLATVLDDRPKELSEKTRKQLDSIQDRIGHVAGAIYQISTESYETETIGDVLKALAWLGEPNRS